MQRVHRFGDASALAGNLHVFPLAQPVPDSRPDERFVIDNQNAESAHTG
jgi:hypothetical protein